MLRSSFYSISTTICFQKYLLKYDWFSSFLSWPLILSWFSFILDWELLYYDLIYSLSFYCRYIFFSIILFITIKDVSFRFWFNFLWTWGVLLKLLLPHLSSRYQLCWWLPIAPLISRILDTLWPPQPSIFYSSLIILNLYLLLI